MDAILRFRTMCVRNGIAIDDRRLDKLNLYVELLLDWNSRINLISRKDEENVWSRHILSSLTVLAAHRFAPSASVIDVGTGGGLPGIPLAIMVPDITVTLLDSIQKKSKAVLEILQKLDLPRVDVLNGRAEDIPPSRHRSYDYVVARGVSTAADMIRWCRPLLRHPNGSPASQPDAEKRALLPPGSIILFKGGDITDEIRQASVKYRQAAFNVSPVIVDGAEAEEFFDKKILVISNCSL